MIIISRSNDHYTRTIDSTRAGHATLRLRIVDAAIALLAGPPEHIEATQGVPRLRLVLSRRQPEAQRAGGAAWPRAAAPRSHAATTGGPSRDRADSRLRRHGSTGSTQHFAMP